MAKPPKTDPDRVSQNLKDRLARYDRGPFLDLTARFLRNAPSEDAIKSKAEKDPESWARSTRVMATLGGYTERSEHVNVNVNASDMVRALVARVGLDRARVTLEASAPGLLALLPNTIEVDEHDGDSAPRLLEPVSG